MAEAFINYLKSRDIKCVVWDMDHTMSAAHCGEGLLRGEAEAYINAVSPDFITLTKELVRQEFYLAVATGSDPKEYDIPGQSKETHILGPDLARALMETCLEPKEIEAFGIMIGYDYRLHGCEPRNEGKRH